MAKKKTTAGVVKVEDKSTALSTMNIEDVPGMLDLVTKQIKSIKGGIPEGPKTTASLSGFGKIDEISTVESLIKAAATVIVKQEAYNNGAEEIMPEGMKVPEFKLSGVTAKNWLLDIKARVILVANKEKLARLNKIRKTLEENLSSKDKFKRDMQSIMDDIKNEE